MECKVQVHGSKLLCDIQNCSAITRSTLIQCISNITFDCLQGIHWRRMSQIKCATKCVVFDPQFSCYDTICIMVFFSAMTRPTLLLHLEYISAIWFKFLIFISTFVNTILITLWTHIIVLQSRGWCNALLWQHAVVFHIEFWWSCVTH